MVNVTFSGGHCCRCESPCGHTTPPSYCDKHRPTQTTTNNITYTDMSSYVPKKHQVCVDKCGCFWRGKYEEKGLVIQSYEEKILLTYEQGLKNGRKQGYNEAMDARDTMDKLKEEE